MKKYIKFIALFIFFFLCLIFFYNINKGDLFVNYGFSYAISKFEIPYKDFNMVITPIAPIIYSIGLFFCKSIIIYYLEQSLLLTIMFYILKKILHEKVYIFLTIMLLPYPISFSTTIFPGYNFLILFLLFFLFYLEIKNRNDYLVGIIIGLIVCTKQTIGLFIFLPNFYYLLKKRKKFFKRLIGFVVPIITLVIYLLITKSLFYFFDLCILGLFNFAENNSTFNYYDLFLYILGIIYIIFKIIKNNNIINFYALSFSIIAIPIIDYYHVSLFLLVIAFLIINDYNLKNKNIFKYSFIFIISLVSIWTFVEFKYLNNPVITNYNNFPLTLNTRNYDNNIKELNNYLQEKNNVIYLLRGSENYFYKIMNNKKIDYYEVPNKGNYGYNGIEKMIKKIKNKKDVYFVLDKSLEEESSNNQQYIKEFATAAKRNSKLERKIGVYEIYYRK